MNKMSCAHEEINETDTGECVCTLCGLVLEILYGLSPPTSIPSSAPASCNLIDSDIYSFIKDVYSRGNIAEGTMQQAVNRYKNLAKKWNRGEKKKQLACFAIYATLTEASTPRTLREIECLSGVSISKMWRIEKKQKETVLDNSENFVERICETLMLPYKDMRNIRSIVAQVSGVAACRGGTIIAAIIWLYVNDKICSCASLQDICAACNVTSSSVRKVIKKINPLYRDNICSFLA